jgi:hypothetical protein
MCQSSLKPNVSLVTEEQLHQPPSVAVYLGPDQVAILNLIGVYIILSFIMLLLLGLFWILGLILWRNYSIDAHKAFAEPTAAPSHDDQNEQEVTYPKSPEHRQLMTLHSMQEGV